MRDTHRDDIMITERCSCAPGLPPGVIFQNSDQCLPNLEPTDDRLMEMELRNALSQSEMRLLQKDELIQRLELLKKESDHRLLNDLQMTISLLSLQSRDRRMQKRPRNWPLRPTAFR